MANEPELQRAATFSVFTRFRAFWREVEALRADIASGTVSPAASGPGLVHGATTAQMRLLAVLREQETELARWATGAALKYYREAQYVMAAVADDLFVRLRTTKPGGHDRQPWSGAAHWIRNPLEAALFGSRCAGQAVFDRIDRLIAGADPNSRELAAVYLTALALGFEGKYAGLPDSGAIDEYKRRLRQFVFGNRDSLTGPLVPQCDTGTMAVGRGLLLQNARVWWWTVPAVVAIWLVVSSLLWRQLRTPIVAGISRADATLSGAAR